MKDGKYDIEEEFNDIVLGRPHVFTLGRKQFYLYPVTLAKLLLQKRLIAQLGIEEPNLKVNTFLEILRVTKSKRELCCTIVAYNTLPNTQKDLFCHKTFVARKNYFVDNISDEDLATLMIRILESQDASKYMKHFGLDKERENIGIVIDVKRKHDKNNLTFNGKTILGNFIAQLKEIGYTDDEILYEKGYVYLQMMLADKIVSLYVSDEESKELPAFVDSNVIDANNPENAKKLVALMGNKGVGVEMG